MSSSKYESKEIKLLDNSPSTQDAKPSHRILDNPCTKVSHVVLGFFKNRVLPHVFSGMKENRLPMVPFLAGDIFWGQAWRVFDADGRGVDRILSEAVEIAYKSGDWQMCQWRFGPSNFVVLILNSSDIHDLLTVQSHAFYHHDSSRSFVELFGQDTIFSLPHGGEKWMGARRRFLNTFFTTAALQQMVVPMQTILSQYIDRMHRDTSKSFNFAHLASFMTMDVIGTKLGLHTVPDAIKQKALDLIAAGAQALASHRSQTLKQYCPFIKYPPISWCYATTIDKIRKAGMQLVMQEILPINEANILSTQNWLNPKGTLTQEDLYSEETVQRIMELYLAGSETSSTLLFFMVMLLADPAHQNVLGKLREEIREQKIPVQNWNYETTQTMEYFELVIKETLRLYPPIPDMLFTFCDKAETRAGQLAVGDMVIVSPRFVHRSKEWGNDAHAFRPERFLDDWFVNHPHQEYLYFPFGFKPRSCPGQKFARLETLLILARLIDEFDISFVHAGKKHPFNSYQLFSLHSDEKDMELNFVPRKAKAMSWTAMGMDGQEQEHEQDEEERQHLGM